MKNNILQNLIKSILFIIVIISIGITLNILRQNTSNTISNESTDDNLCKGIGLFISNKDNNIHNHVINYSNIDDYSYKFMNTTGKDINCTLNVFVNGKQVELLDTENNTLNNKYNFSINDGEDKNIPIKLNLDTLDTGSFIVNFNLILDSNDNAINKDEKVWITSTYNYIVGIENGDSTITIPEAKNPILSEQENIIDAIPDSDQFIINYSKDEFLSNSIAKNYIETSPNQIVEIPLIVGGNSSVNSLIYATLNNKQTLINNSDVLVCNLIKNKCTATNFKITAPDTPGNYELIFYSISNFDSENIDNVYNLKYSSSNRITLVVN
ncbi:hypothetical protein [Clostridium sp. VAP51]|uniref:hypothetical protein n=1 Tax=Clostridium sp. VAP51 TaxID=2949978 RepID=UPI00207AC4A0|nr:hypothetical protein [Clostridium sp. VAP51]